MAKIKVKKVIEYNTVVPRPRNRAPKGQLIVGKQFEVKPVAPVNMKKK